MRTSRDERHLQSLLATYFRDTLGLPRWEAAVERRLSIGRKHEANRLGAFVDFEGAVVLDVGCGSGETMEAISACAEAVIGVEPDKEWAHAAMARCARQDSRHYSVVVSVGEVLPFRDATFDIVLSNFVVEHVQDVNQVIAEMLRTLKPGGYCIISAPNYLFPMEPHYRIPWIPLLPKKLGALVLRLLGRDPEYYVRHINYVTPFAIVRSLHETRATNVTNVLVKAVAHPELIASPRWSAVARVVRWLRVPSFLIYLLSPSFSIMATKAGNLSTTSPVET